LAASVGRVGSAGSSSVNTHAATTDHTTTRAPATASLSVIAQRGCWSVNEVGRYCQVGVRPTDRPREELLDALRRGQGVLSSGRQDPKSVSVQSLVVSSTCESITFFKHVGHTLCVNLLFVCSEM
jgi:hypothetical protein